MVWIPSGSGELGPVDGFWIDPHPVTNAEFARTLGRVLGRPAWLTTPAFALRLLLGEMADALVLERGELSQAALAPEHREQQIDDEDDEAEPAAAHGKPAAHAAAADVSHLARVEPGSSTEAHAKSVPARAQAILRAGRGRPGSRNRRGHGSRTRLPRGR